MDADVLIVLKIVRHVLEDEDLRTWVLDDLDLEDEAADRLLAGVNKALQETAHEPQG